MIPRLARITGRALRPADGSYFESPHFRDEPARLVADRAHPMFEEPLEPARRDFW